MTFDELATRLREVGFAVAIDRFEGDEFDPATSRLTVAKLASTPGNRLGPLGHEREFMTEEDGPGVATHFPTAQVWLRSGTYEFSVCCAIPRSPGMYDKVMRSAEEAYEEVLHYFFDADSRMRLEPDFVAGPGRPEGVPQRPRLWLVE